jgi:large subunit ribosomal protein L12
LQDETRRKNMAKVNYVYGALLLHSAGKAINEAHLKKVIEATGESVEEAQVKALVSSLEGVNIEEAIKSAAVAVAAPAASAAAPAADKKDDKKSEEEDKKKAEEAVAGLGALFG